MKVIVAVTAASGAIYARLVLEHLLRSTEVERIALIMSEKAAEVVAFEGEQLPREERITVYDNSDMFGSPASGSARWDAMVVAPSSVGTVGRVAAGVSQTLIERAADVMLKERRRLIFVVRETPLSLIHLRNMVALTEAGGIVVPASPSFYFCPESIEEVAMSVTQRAVAMLGIATDHPAWGDKE